MIGRVEAVLDVVTKDPAVASAIALYRPRRADRHLE